MISRKAIIKTLYKALFYVFFIPIAFFVILILFMGKTFEEICDKINEYLD
ncbi:MAG: hypothetical protein JSV62_12875 [Promethearchaeota archaeon]|nr:MAG: hypothetical protein JSV62_12875 [Candidatus Lokiarchaeota archaeon]